MPTIFHLLVSRRVGNNLANRSVRTIVKIGLCVRAIVAALALEHVAFGADFVWKHGTIRIGQLNVPAGFKVENYDYREGIITTLLYEDGSRVTLQSGGMFRLPLFQGDGYSLISSTDLGGKTVRIGRSANGESCWREDNYKPKKVTGKRISLLGLFPPNVGYSMVPAARRSEFDHALDSFVREIDRTR